MKIKGLGVGNRGSGVDGLRFRGFGLELPGVWLRAHHASAPTTPPPHRAMHPQTHPLFSSGLPDRPAPAFPVGCRGDAPGLTARIGNGLFFGWVKLGSVSWLPDRWTCLGCHVGCWNVAGFNWLGVVALGWAWGDCWGDVT